MPISTDLRHLYETDLYAWTVRNAALLRDNPSLQAQLPTLLPEAYESAVLQAVRETGLDEAVFSRNCPFTPDQALDAEFWSDWP